MQVSQAVAQRRSVRAFLDKPVSDELLRQLLEKAGRAPSGGNLQPWRVFVITAPLCQRSLNSSQGARNARKLNTPFIRRI